MLILEMRERTADLASAEARNRFVIENGDKLWTPHVSRGGMLERLVRERETNHGIHPPLPRPRRTG